MIFFLKEILEAKHLEDSRDENILIYQKLTLGYAAITNISQIFVVYNYEDLFLAHVTGQLGVRLKKQPLPGTEGRQPWQNDVMILKDSARR